MELLLGIAGIAALMLFLARRFVRHRTTFGEFRARRDGRCEETLAALRWEATRMNADEAMAPVIAGVREMLCTSGRPEDPNMRVERTADGPRLTLCVPKDGITPCIEIGWVVQSVHIRTGTREMRRGYWEVHRQGLPVRRHEDLAELMHEIDRFLSEDERETAE